MHEAIMERCEEMIGAIIDQTQTRFDKTFEEM